MRKDNTNKGKNRRSADSWRKDEPDILDFDAAKKPKRRRRQWLADVDTASADQPGKKKKGKRAASAEENTDYGLPRRGTGLGKGATAHSSKRQADAGDSPWNQLLYGQDAEDILDDDRLSSETAESVQQLLYGQSQEDILSDDRLPSETAESVQQLLYGQAQEDIFGDITLSSETAESVREIMYGSDSSSDDGHSSKRGQRNRGGEESSSLRSAAILAANQQTETRQEKREKRKHRDKQEGFARAMEHPVTGNHQFWVITGLFLLLFGLLIGYMVYFQVVKSDSFISSSYNSRLDLYAERVIRGDILSSEGDVLATTVVDEDGEESRSYPFGRVFAHVVGYTNNGKSGLEKQYNFNLLRSHSFFLTQIVNELKDEKSMGDSVVTTLSTQLQQAAYDALGDNDGAVVVLEASTGKVLAMVSKPDYDPNTLADSWDSIINDDSSSVLVNRATSGAYPPGSIFKLFTTLEYVHENDSYTSYAFTCSGSFTVDGETISCYHGSSHGSESLMTSFANSCNASYASLSLTLDLTQFSSLLESMLFNTTLPGSLSSTKSSFSLSSDANTGKIMQTAIGQGDTTVSPLHMAMIAAAISQDGVLYEPYLVDHTENDKGTVVRQYTSTEYGSLLSVSDARLLQEYMRAVVTDGTASALNTSSYTAAGKTGSAEYDSNGNSHGWFIGYASKEGYEDIAIAVIVEDGDSGSKSAVPVAKAVFEAYFH